MGEQQEHKIVFRITFTTNSVSPTKVPTFYYVATNLDFDRLTYVAIVQDKDFNSVIEQVMAHWEDASIRRIEAGATELPHHKIGDTFGSSPTIKPSLIRRIGRKTPVVGFFVD